jgi:hypothetical protein
VAGAVWLDRGTRASGMLRSFEERRIECKQVFFPNAVFEVHSTYPFSISSRTGLDIRLSVRPIRRSGDVRCGQGGPCIGRTFLRPGRGTWLMTTFLCRLKGLLDVYMYLRSFAYPAAVYFERRAFLMKLEAFISIFDLASCFTYSIISENRHAVVCRSERNEHSRR